MKLLFFKHIVKPCCIVLSFIISLSICFNLGYVPANALTGFSYSDVEAYSNEPYVYINNNEPDFREYTDYTYTSFEEYSLLDDLGRCGEAYACIGTDIMPTEDRGSISSVKPSGWYNVTYDFIPGKYLYNRCHLIGFQLTGENANKLNLITGTRYLNIEGMLPFENMVASYIKSTDYHVLYRVTPVFVDNELVARGVLIEALSLEDNGEGISFCVFCYNVQPGVDIDYSTGKSQQQGTAPQNSSFTYFVTTSYIANKNSLKYHLPECSSVTAMSESNKIMLTATVSEMAELGYVPCSRCKPEQNSKTASYYYGDADLDGSVNSSDARLTLRASVGLESFDSLRIIICDADRDGKITASDARLILRSSVGLEYI